ncbi:hypothetical protein TRSC58_04765 [Trypanosoma rangeli SC58]|uniref:Uncharacterized protein n=1 Tax=Trypanosoma rangeli SC58 TaxID=429131 RepID=A0A061IY04_TRYRA|nr:hypothetical protein TRSC58_04765 [Trypanosoma rangeli SC58]
MLAAACLSRYYRFFFPFMLFLLNLLVAACVCVCVSAGGRESHMQHKDAAAAPPMALIQWWFGKTEEERRGFLQNPMTSARARENIPLVEAYVRRHCYFVACETNLDVCPMPSLSPVLQTTLQRRGYGVWLPCAAHGEGTYGGRYIAGAQRGRRCAAAQHIFEDICARTAVALCDYSPRLGPTPPLPLLEEERCCVRAARVMVEALVEASVAALYRLRLTDALETIEQNAARDGTSGLRDHEREGGGVAPKPVSVRRAEAHSCLGIWMLLLPHAAGGEGAAALSTLSATQGGKRPRNADTNCGLQPTSQQQQQLPHDARVTCWQLLRERIAPAAAEEWQHESSAAKDGGGVAVMVPHSDSRIMITLADMRFGIAKALKNRVRQAK